ncbi:DUF6702 family protein [Aureibacter tunicatorum]|uniref:Uncharacterized protein n=1 Tax=Aureibacter tunicatorum TaxID=866807 RepID=A0AAE3XJP7_9BACT|nr:DUF6702 family protein [Aureibacter tunicatorum]MDR6237263.1 hypothetical protein [Aureibacter tunicatorum]BDD06255.1 hypothetical protein AUTU_37380 [Aureibacter tunicatorum]
MLSTKLSLAFFYAIMLNMHPFYISVMQINYDEAENSLQISTRIFADDLELALSERGVEGVDLLDHSQEFSDEVKVYLQDRLKFDVNGKPEEFDFLGIEPDGDALWVYMEINGVRKLKDLKIMNSILTDARKKQQNIVKLTVDGEKMVYKLDENKTTIEYDAK